MNIQEPLLTTEDVAKYLNVEVVTVRRLVGRGELAAFRVGGEFRFAPADVEAFLKRQYLPAHPAVPSASPAPGARYFGEPWLSLSAVLSRREQHTARGAKPARGERFTERAQHVLALTQAEAEQQQAAEIEPIHLLLALAAEGGGGAARALRECGLTVETLRATLAQHPDLASAPRAALDQPQALAAGIKQALEAAVGQANKLRHDYVSTAHLLLGLLDDAQSAAMRLLTRLNAKPEAIRKRAVAALKDDPGHEAPRQ